MLRLSRALPWEQVHALQGGWELLCRSRRQEFPSPKLLLELGLSFHTSPVLGLALSERGDVSQEFDLAPGGTWILQLCGMGTDPSRALTALPSAGAVWHSHHPDRNLVGSLG